MDRREFVLGGVAAGVLAAGAAEAGGHSRKKAHSRSHGAPTDPSPHAELLAEIADDANDCVEAGDKCVAYCARVLAAGDPSMGACNIAVHNMLAVCEAMSKLAAYGTANMSQLKALAAVCARLCRACERACRPHADHHEACRECMEECQNCAESCEKLVAG